MVPDNAMSLASYPETFKILVKGSAVFDMFGFCRRLEVFGRRVFKISVPRQPGLHIRKKHLGELNF